MLVVCCCFAEVRTTAIMEAKAMQLSILQVMLECSQCLLHILLFAPHPDRSSSSRYQSLPHLQGETSTTLVGGVVLDELLECASVAFAAMVGTLELLDGMAPSRNILEESRVHRAITITNKFRISNPMHPLSLQEPLQDDVSLHL